MKHHSSLIPEDWEHEARKDFIYLMEVNKRLEEEWQQWEEEHKEKLPAKIEIIKEEKPKEDEVQPNTLPF